MTEPDETGPVWRIAVWLTCAVHTIFGAGIAMTAAVAIWAATPTVSTIHGAYGTWGAAWRIGLLLGWACTLTGWVTTVRDARRERRR